ncbi:hypothetical protein HOP62_12575 [Halomonas sp. MCCC 1A17488]|uniref:Glycosyltransferase 2-like domain-containing protein n=1 Tax=Billgrantia sulfidoxydans TaxID=2733484 RepID=A0ABX7W0R6_9GAMM|nr:MULTISPECIES: hypothetical protein [Halomonas]MCE8016904.1 hypothetical protein [Halomonas sp. MCCC 1A17488]MCG3240237.1 hypothetical protein [Halomonas sp. MCCC 1A17488]QPP49886.1 hypothetical protein I4484_01775 [Halomonas sp. SS10-MC5]QTP53501.1 hypothetical protein HNO51_01680 [Halomonas sulfidoxydans]
MPLASVIFDARAAGAKLPRSMVLFEQAARRWQGGYELLLVDDTGDRRLPDLAQRYQVMLVSCSAANLGSRFNAAVRVSRGDVLLFPGLGDRRAVDWLSLRLIDLDLEPESGWDAAVLPVRRHSWLRWWWLLQRPSPLDTFWVARDWFERIGGFDPQLGSDALPDLLERLRACQARVSIETA